MLGSRSGLLFQTFIGELKGNEEYKKRVLKEIVAAICSTQHELSKGFVLYGLQHFLSNYQQSVIDPILSEIISHQIQLNLQSKQFEERKNESSSSSSSRVILLDDNHVLAILNVVKYCRKLGYLSIDQINQILNEKSINFQELIENSLLSLNPDLKLATISLISTTKSAMTDPLSIFEVKILQMFVSDCLKGGNYSKTETSFSLQKLVVRLKGSFRYLLLQSRGKYHAKKNKQQKMPKNEKLEEELLFELKEFLNDISNRILTGVYPGSPSSKVLFSIQLFNSLLMEVWGYKEERGIKIEGKVEPSGVAAELFLSPSFIKNDLNIYSNINWMRIISSFWEEFEKTREIAFLTLKKFQSNLLISQPSSNDDQRNISQNYLKTALRLISSVRAKEGDVGSLILRLLLSYYYSNPSSSSPIQSLLISSNNNKNDNNNNNNNNNGDNNNIIIEGENESIEEFTKRILKGEEVKHPIVQLIIDLEYLLEEQLIIAEKDIIKASKEGPMHGILLAIRYIIHDIDFNSSNDQQLKSLKFQWKFVFTFLLSQIERIIKIGIGIVGDIAPEGYNAVKQTPYYPENPTQLDDNNNNNNDDEEDDSDQFNSTSEGRLVVMCSWLSIKGCSLLMGTLINQLPLSSHISSFNTITADDKIKNNSNDNNNNNKEDEEGIITNEQVEWIGDKLLQILLSTRHKGALEKTYLGFEVVCNRLMKSNNVYLNKLPAKWVNELYHKVSNPSTIITRRSAGLPFAFLSILRAEVSLHRGGVHSLLTSTFDFLLRNVLFKFI